MARGQDAIETVIGEAELIVVDNLSAWARSGVENEGESWLPIAGWALRMRREGRSVLCVHHAGKNGAQRGTSRREDLLDVVLKLKRPGDYRAEEGARFEVHFEKARRLFGEAVRSLEATLTRDETADPEGRAGSLSILYSLQPGALKRKDAVRRVTGIIAGKGRG